MIFIDRGRLLDGQPILPRGTWLERAANKTTDAIHDGPAHVVSGLYRDPDVKAALERLFSNKCAYCESPGFAGFPWDVEHFRPKGSVAEDISHPGYYWLAYTWTNLYPSCVFCNQRRRDQPTFDDPIQGPATGKLDQFPLAEEHQRAHTPDDSLADEDPLLLDPCRDQPELHLAFDAAGGVSPRGGSAKGEMTIRVFGLRRKRLRDARLDVLATISELIEETVAVGALRDKATRAVLDVMSRPHRQYSALVSAIRDDPAIFGFLATDHDDGDYGPASRRS
jgi:uncharacterized protein (TIGR02646 family)